MSMVTKLMESGALQDVMASLGNSATQDDRVTVDDYRDKDDGKADDRSESPKEEPRSAQASAQAMPDLASLMNPEMMKMLPGLLGMLGSNKSDSGKHDGGDCQRALLLALRPFLNENRRRAIDMMISMEKLGVLRDILPKER